MPLVSKAFGDIITFTRASTGTFTGSNGLIQSAAIDAPRFDYDPVTLAAKGLLIEEQRTNLFTYSEDFSNAAWTKGNATVTADAAVSPDGATTADSFIENTATSGHTVAFGSITFAASTAYTAAIYVKPTGRSWFYMQLASAPFGGVNTRAWFNVTTGVVGTQANCTGSIQAVGNGWYRCGITVTATVGGVGATAIVLGLSNADNVSSYTGDGTSGAFIWGAQLEAGSFATSYIPTVASQVTRSADVASVNTLSPWFNASEGTLYAEATDGAPSSTARGVWSLDSGASNRIDLRRQTSTALWNVVTTGGVDQGILIYSNTAVNGVSFKNALAYKVNDLAGSVNGGSVQTDTSATIPSVTALQIGSLAAFGSPFNGTIRRITYYPRRLSNAELQAITA